MARPRRDQSRITAEQDEKLQRKLALKNNEVVKAPIARIDAKITADVKAAKRGRKKKYTPTKMKNEINRYFDFCETEDRVPSIKGLMIFLKMYRDQFYTYLEYPEFTSIMEHARLIIAEWCENDVYNTRGQAAGKIAYMKNVHEWSEKTESQTTVKQIVSADEARAKIEMLAPKLLEVLKSSNMLSQIIQKEDTPEAPESILEAEVIPSLGMVEEVNVRRL